MHHNHRAFDAADPDASQALRDALPIVAQIRAELAKAQPKNVDLLRAWRDHIADLRDQLDPLAARAGCSANELEQIAAAEMRHLPPAAPAAPAPAAPAAPATSARTARAELENERVSLLGELRALCEEASDTARRRKIAVDRLTAVEMALFPRRRGRA